MELSLEKFYLVGFSCFFIIAACQICNFFIFMRMNNVFSNILSVAQIIFSMALTGLFSYLYRQNTRTRKEISSFEDIKKELK